MLGKNRSGLARLIADTMCSYMYIILAPCTGTVTALKLMTTLLTGVLELRYVYVCMYVCIYVCIYVYACMGLSRYTWRSMPEIYEILLYRLFHLTINLKAGLFTVSLCKKVQAMERWYILHTLSTSEYFNSLFILYLEVQLDHG